MACIVVSSDLGAEVMVRGEKMETDQVQDLLIYYTLLIKFQILGHHSSLAPSNPRKAHLCSTDSNSLFSKLCLVQMLGIPDETISPSP